MDEQELKNQSFEEEFSLEDIIKEFSDLPQEEVTPILAEEPEEDPQIQLEETVEVQLEEETDAQLEEIMEETLEEILGGILEEPQEELWEEPQEELQEEPQEEPVAVTEATIRLEAIPGLKGTVRNAAPITREEEDDVTPYIPVVPQGAEPYSEEWEPEYEQPIAEYVPPRPILFHPRSRLRELKRKLVNGPERMYYEMSEKGLGKLQLAIFFSLLVVLLTAGATAMYAMGWVGENRLRLMIFGQFLAMLISAFFGSNQLIEGGVDIFKKRFSLNSMLLVSFVLCCADGVLCLLQLRLPCCAAFSLQMTMSLWNAYHKRNTQLGQLDTMRKAVRLDSITRQEDYLEGAPALLRGEGQVEDFMDTLDSPSQLDKVISVYALVCLGISLATGVAAGVLHGVSVGIQVASVTALAAIPASMFVTLSRPMAVLERRHHALGTVLCGWQGVEGMCNKVLFPLNHEDLLPVDGVKMNGVKFYGSRQPDEIISYAAALVAADGGSLTHLFEHLLESRNGMHYDVTQFCGYENGGIGGIVNDESVLVGTKTFLKEMGVQIPEGIRVHQAVCVAIDGELCGLFAVVFEKDNNCAAGFATLCGYRNLHPVITGGDFVLTESFLKNHFDVKAKRVVIPEDTQRRQLAERAQAPEAKALALVTSQGLAPFAYAVTGARALKSAAKAGVIVHMIGGILGMLMMLALAIIGATQLLTPANMFLYELVWMVPGLLITEWTRSI